MKFRIAILAACLLIASRAAAAVSLCAITGVVSDGAGNPLPNAVVTFNSQNTQVISGNTIAPIFKSASTDANGNLSSISLAQGLVVQVTVCQAQGGGCGAAQTAVVPLATTITFANLLSGTISAGTGTSTGFGANVTPFGSQSSGTQTCPISGACSVTLTGSGVTLSASPPAVPTTTTQMLVWQVTQDATGGRLPTWSSSAFAFSLPSGGGSSGVPITPITAPNATEDILFIWNPATAKWDYLARSGVQQRAQTSQGGNAAIGGPSNATNTITTLPANTWTQVTADNGGFFPPENGGATTYTYQALGSITLCNANATTEFFSVTLGYGATQNQFFERITADRPIDGNHCDTVPFTVNISLPATTTFGTFGFLINPTNTLRLLQHTYFTQETPTQ